MLTRLRLAISAHAQALVRGACWLWQAGLTVTLTWLVLLVSMILMMVFGALAHHFDDLSHHVHQVEYFEVYLTPGLSADRQQAVLASINSAPGVSAALLRTPEEGLTLLQKETDLPDIAALLVNNPLPPVIEVTPRDTHYTTHRLQHLRVCLGHYRDVDDVHWVSQSNGQVLRAMMVLARGLSLLCGMLAFVLMMVANRQLWCQHRDEMRILWLIGANDRHIRRFYLYLNALFAGFTAAVAAAIGLPLRIHWYSKFAPAPQSPKTTP